MNEAALSHALDGFWGELSCVLHLLIGLDGFEIIATEKSFKSTKAKLIWWRSREAHQKAGRIVVDFISGFCNPRRHPSVLGPKSPVAFERNVA